MTGGQAAPFRGADVHIPVEDLQVPQAWHVGRVTFRPAGWLQSYTASQVAVPGTAQEDFLRRAREQMSRHRGATATIRARWRDGDHGPIVLDALEHVRDSIAVLRLYQVAMYPLVGRDLQQFGVSGDVGSAMLLHTATQGRNIIATGGRWLGVIGSWTFSRGDVRSFRDHPVFAFLDEALRTPNASRTQLQRRAITAVRTRALATGTLPVQMQIVLLATAVEAMLGDDTYQLGQYYRVAQRAAYVYCGFPTEWHHPTTPACLYLTAPTAKEMKIARRDRAAQGLGAFCSAFGHAYDLTRFRNEALHGGRTDFGRRTWVLSQTAADQISCCAPWLGSLTAGLTRSAS